MAIPKEEPLQKMGFPFVDGHLPHRKFIWSKDLLFSFLVSFIDLEFEVGDHVFLKVTPWTGVGRALKSRKLTPRFIGPFQILKRVGPVAYQIALPPSMFLSKLGSSSFLAQELAFASLNSDPLPSMLFLSC